MNVDFDKLWETLTAHFYLGDWSLHGPNHWRNVELNALKMARQNDADEMVVRLFAVFHDAERRNEGYDPEHGKRAAAFARQLHGDVFAIDHNQLDRLCEACELHNHGFVSDDVTVGTCWDADRLDLPRVGIRPDPAKMSTKEGRELARAR